MKTALVIWLLWIAALTNTAWGQCSPDVAASLSNRFSSAQIQVLCGKASQSFVTIEILTVCHECSKWNSILSNLIQIVRIKSAPLGKDFSPQSELTPLFRPSQGGNTSVNVALQSDPGRVRLNIPTADDSPSNRYISYDDKVEQVDFILKPGDRKIVTVYLRPDNFNSLRELVGKVPRFVVTKIEPL
jgi:hypothetical protein